MLVDSSLCRGSRPPAVAPRQLGPEQVIGILPAASNSQDLWMKVFRQLWVRVFVGVVEEGGIRVLSQSI
ncbi:MAG: hypothetical protein ACJ72N_20970 [Labedaea sp.]